VTEFNIGRKINTANLASTHVLFYGKLLLSYEPGGGGILPFDYEYRLEFQTLREKT